MKESKTRGGEEKKAKNKKKCKERVRTVETLVVIDFLARWQYLPVYFQNDLVTQEKRNEWCAG